MANIRLIRRRIKSVQNIAQITRAMEMVAASKMRKAQERANMGKPYAEKIYEITRELASHTEKRFHPLLALGNPTGKLLIVFISTNKGLCGSLNTNLFRMAYQWLKEEKEVNFISLGKKGMNFIVRRGWNLVADFSSKTPFTESVPAVTSYLIEGFINGVYREVYLVYNTFLTAFRQIPTKKIILPISSFAQEKTEGKSFPEFLVEPSIPDILENLLPYYLETQVRAAILESEASEHSARMIAMKNASESATDLMSEIILIYNKARQEKITSEIADMVTARMAVE